MRAEPLPFHLPLPGRDVFGLDEARSEWYRMHGLLHCDGETLTFEWSTAAHVENVSLLDGVTVDDQVSPAELWDVPVSLIADVRLTGGWWAPRLHLRARRIDAFEGIPGAGPGAVTLRFRRRDRAIAAAMVDHLLASASGRAVAPSSRRGQPSEAP